MHEDGQRQSGPDGHLEQVFVAAGGTVKADVTLPQGKVFSVPNESEKAFVTNDGKVF